MILEPMTAAEAARMRGDTARVLGMSPNGVVVSQLGYLPVPEATRRTVGRGGWIPRSVPVSYVAHPLWWLEDSARLRRPGEDDDDYAGRVYWDLVGRGLLGDEGVVDVLWSMLRIDLAGYEGRQRVEDWLAGETDRELCGLWVAESPQGLRWAEREAARARPQLEARLAKLVAADLETAAGGAADAADRFREWTPEGMAEPLVEAIRTFLSTGDVKDRAAVGESATAVQASITAAVELLDVLYKPLGELPAPGLGGPEWERRLTERVGWFYRSPSPETADQLWTEAIGQIRAVCDVGMGAAGRLEGWAPVVPHRNRTARVAARFAEDVYGPPPVILSPRALRRAER